MLRLTAVNSFQNNKEIRTLCPNHNIAFLPKLYKADQL
jgi:hypothetical protein